MTKDNADATGGHTANPGSDEALAAGCTCPVLDNAHGRGYMGIEGVFVMTEKCPLHGTAVKPEVQS